MSDITAIKHLSRSRETEEKKLAERRRAVLVLILRHLIDYGYVDAYERLSTECNVSLSKVMRDIMISCVGIMSAW